MNRRLRAYLRKQGASHEAIERAEHEGRIPLLAFDRLLMPGRPRYTFADMAWKAGVDLDLARKLWRALGFPDPPHDELRFTDEDVDTLRTLRDWFRSETFPAERSVDGLVQQVRVVGAALARIAEVQSDVVITAFADAREQGLTDERIAMMVPEVFDWQRLSRLIDYAMRLQFRAALWRKLAGEDPAETGTGFSAVGFVDLVGYTALSQELDAEELAMLVNHFEAVAYDTVAEHGGRVVKMIGDEVMFVAEDVVAAAQIALRLTARSLDDEALPGARAAVACGSLVIHEGDYYGPVVNLASRLVEIARPGSVLASESMHRALDHHDAFDFQRLRSRRLRNIGRVEIYVIRSAEQPVEADGA